MIEQFKNILKKNKYLSYFNTRYKIAVLKYDLTNLTNFYNQNKRPIYDYNDSLKSFKLNLDKSIFLKIFLISKLLLFFISSFSSKSSLILRFNSKISRLYRFYPITSKFWSC